MEFPNIPKFVSYIAAILFIISTAFAANSYVAKDKDLTAFKNETKQDFALLNKSFQADQLSRDEKDVYRQLYDAQDRLKKIGPNKDLNDRIRDLLNQLEDIKEKKEKLKTDFK